MSLRGQKGLVPIASVSVEDWQDLYRFCKLRDVTTGGDYETPPGGAINIWLQANWTDQEGALHGTYYPQPSKRFGWVDVLWQTGHHKNEDGRFPWEESTPEYAWSKNWSPSMAREYFCTVFEEATGKTYATSLTEFDKGRTR